MIPEDRFVELGGAHIETRLWRSGTDQPAIVMLHEGLGSVSSWRDFPARLAQRTHRTVIAYSRRGYGRSTPVNGPRAPDYLHREANLVPGFLDLFEIGRAILFGHSDGGSIALIAAARHPDRVAGLILEAAHAFAEPSTRQAVRDSGRRWRETDLPERMAHHHDDPAGAFFGWHDIWLSASFDRWSIMDELGQIRCPTLAIRGDRDEFASARQLHAIAKAVPGAHTLSVPGCGHVPHRDSPETVLAGAVSLVRAIRTGSADT